MAHERELVHPITAIAALAEYHRSVCGMLVAVESVIAELQERERGNGNLSDAEIKRRLTTSYERLCTYMKVPPAPDAVRWQRDLISLTEREIVSSRPPASPDAAP